MIAIFKKNFGTFSETGALGLSSEPSVLSQHYSFSSSRMILIFSISEVQHFKVSLCFRRGFLCSSFRQSVWKLWLKKNNPEHYSGFFSTCKNHWDCWRKIPFRLAGWDFMSFTIINLLLYSLCLGRSGR